MIRLPKKMPDDMARAMEKTGLKPGVPCEGPRHEVAAKGVPLTPQARMVKREMRRGKKQ